jgi:hypothetical protein
MTLSEDDQQFHGDDGEEEEYVRLPKLSWESTVI